MAQTEQRATKQASQQWPFTLLYPSGLLLVLFTSFSSLLLVWLSRLVRSLARSSADPPFHVKRSEGPPFLVAFRLYAPRLSGTALPIFYEQSIQGCRPPPRAFPPLKHWPRRLAHIVTRGITTEPTTALSFCRVSGGGLGACLSLSLSLVLSALDGQQINNPKPDTRAGRSKRESAPIVGLRCTTIRRSSFCPSVLPTNVSLSNDAGLWRSRVGVRLCFPLFRTAKEGRKYVAE